MHPHQRLPTSPVADPANVLAGDDWRITVLTPHVVRLEHGPTGSAEDRASQLVLHRDLPPVDREVVDGPDWLEVRTAGLHLRYDRQPFWPGGLSVTARGGASNYRSTWRPGADAAPHEDPLGTGNLRGTARTLDMVDGRTPLDDGLLSRHGITVVDDSTSLLFDDAGMLHPRTPGTTDLYVFAHGRDYRAALDDFHALTGPQPRLPRYALGNWWSRYHRYTARDYTALLDRFDDEGLPFSVAVIDMDWHLVDIPPRLGSGWTGYTWNRELFDDPGAFLADLHDRGLAVTLNVHPADGVRAHEDAYEAMATRMGIDPASELPVAFDAADPEFLAAYLEEVHHPLEAMGVDFWWLDWQQESITTVPGLDPLWVLNHVHWLDANRGDEPGITFSRWAGLGSHRYPVGFSGDSEATWASLEFQPEFTATAANVGYGWWSHDIGGHFFGVRDDELTTRWVQFGVFSPILRLHASADPFSRREPWTLSSPHREVVGDFLRLRHRLLPYLATMAHRAHVDNRSLVAPMYHDHPWEDEAYLVPNEYAFGSELVVAPITSPMDDQLAMGVATAWLPPGDWVDLFTGVAYGGARTLRLHRPITSIPVLARAGAIVPLQPADGLGNDTGIPLALEVVVVPGADGGFALVEDDGDRIATTELSWDDERATLRIGATTGDVAVVPADRELVVVLLGFGPVDEVAVAVAGRSRTIEPGDRDERGALRVALGSVSREVPVEVVVSGTTTPTTTGPLDRVFAVLDRARIGRRDKNRAWDLVRASATPADAAAQLPALGLPPVLVDALGELLLARPGGWAGP